MKNKVDKGADYIVTQMFFDNKKYFEFVDEVPWEWVLTFRLFRIIKPLDKITRLTNFSLKFFIDQLLEELADEAEKCKTTIKIKQLRYWMGS